MNPELEITDDVIDAFIEFNSRGTYYHHPDVEPYSGTLNGDSLEAFHRRMLRAALTYALSKVKRALPEKKIKVRLIRDVCFHGVTHYSGSDVEVAEIDFEKGFALVDLNSLLEPAYLRTADFQTLPESCPHCFHGDGTMLLSHPPQVNLICCYCGHRERYRAQPDSKPYSHGVYAPKVIL